MVCPITQGDHNNNMNNRDPYLIGHCKQLEKVQCWAARFVKRTTLGCLLSFLNLAGKPSDRRRNSRLSLMYKSLHGLAGISTSPFRRSSNPLVQLMATHSVSCPLEPILTSTPSILVPLLTGITSRHL